MNATSPILIQHPSVILERIERIENDSFNKILDINDLRYFFKQIHVQPNRTLILSTTRKEDIENAEQVAYKSIVNTYRINDIGRLNRFFEAVNAKLHYGGIFIGCLETKTMRIERLMNKFPFPLNHIYLFFDFVLKRVFPKLPITLKIYFWITKGRNRVISRAEALGRLYSCGFEIISERVIHRQHYFIAKKVKKPVFDPAPTYGPFIYLNRVGRGGKLVKIYKLRTMHPFSEYLQEHIYKHNHLDKGGKFKNDYRISKLGCFLRKTWLDELPMFINLLKGDVKFVGVRPLSQHYFSLYPKEFQKFRIKFKPGILPPYYVDMPETIEEIVESERRYLLEYQKNPLKTDLKYFFKALVNIVCRGKRSK